MKNNWQDRLQLAAEAVAINDFDAAKIELDIAHGQALGSGSAEAIEKVKAFYNFMQLELSKYVTTKNLEEKQRDTPSKEKSLSISDGMLGGAVIGGVLGTIVIACFVFSMICDMAQGRGGSFFGNEHNFGDLLQYLFVLLQIGSGITIVGAILGALYAHETGRAIVMKADQEEEARKKALLHDRFYRGKTLEETWKLLTKYFSNEAPDHIRTWTIKTPDTDSGDMVVHWGRNIETTQVYTENPYSKHPRYKNVTADIHIKGHILVRELQGGTRVLFYWNYSWEPKGMTLDEERTEWMIQYFESIWMRVYNELDQHMRCPAEIGVFQTDASGTNETTPINDDIGEAIRQKRLDS
ncbi:MAG: hypothetical protein K2Y22_02150 [Candidatus Obscuribacterales bacterium]|nr:hypothetical protein [Candidatus Obscuribacterales bacterium]